MVVDTTIDYADVSDVVSVVGFPDATIALPGGLHLDILKTLIVAACGNHYKANR